MPVREDSGSWQSRLLLLPGGPEAFSFQANSVITPFVAGRFEREGSMLYVSRGTANSLPLRLGAPTEVGLFELVDPA